MVIIISNIPGVNCVYFVTFLVTPEVLVQLLEQSKERGERKTR